MSTAKKTTVALIGAVVFVLVLAGAFALGSNAAPDKTDAQAETKTAFKESFKPSFQKSFVVARSQGLKTGKARGSNAGRRQGQSEGNSHGTAHAEDELAAIAAQEAEAARVAAEAEASQRAANCGAPLFSEGYCPTDAEIAQENAAEQYCGGGDYETAAALGIEC